MATGYSIASYGEMVDCEPRMSAYSEALRKAITPGCTVIDIGAGFGIFSLLACQFGAGSVIAIEPDDSIELLRPLAEANGCSDQITIVRDLSTRFVPETKADVVISDLRSILPLFEHHIASISDARDRLLAPGGKLLPGRDTLRIALVNSASAYKSRNHPWSSNRYGLDLSAGRPFSVNAVSKVYLSERALISDMQDLADLDYMTIDGPNLDATVDLVAKQDRIAHGLLIWFDTEIGQGAGFSNAPGQPKQVYSQTFFPFEKAVGVAEGDRIRARIRASLVAGSYVWSWDSTIVDSVSGAVLHAFRQSTFFSKIYSPSKLEGRSSGLIPSEDPRFQIDRACLSLVDGKRDLGVIAGMIAERYPDQFKDNKQALDHVSALVGRYSDAGK